MLPRFNTEERSPCDKTAGFYHLAARHVIDFPFFIIWQEDES